MPGKTKKISLNLNTATLEELSNVQQIGPERAMALIEYRKKNGRLADLNDLLRVKGFDEQLVDDLESIGAALGETGKVEQY